MSLFGSNKISLFMWFFNKGWNQSLFISNNGIKISKSSSYFESLSWPNPNNPKFLNIVLKVITNLEPLSLLNKCKEIEKKIGRKKSFKNSPRVCDIDILDYNKRKMSHKMTLPHPRMHSRNFVLLPLFEINKHWIHPITKQHIKRLLLLLPNRDITSIKQIWFSDIIRHVKFWRLNK